MRGVLPGLLTIAGRGCAAALALALVLHGSTKRPPVRHSAAPAPSPAPAAVRTAPSVAPVPRIPDPPEAPPGMCAATNWWRRGAFSDWRRVDFPAGWSFPWGTGRLRSAALLACGEIRPPGDPAPVASVGTPLGLAPESFPDERIAWSSEGGIEFVGGSTGRSVTVRGVVPGRAKLKVAIRDDERGMPEFSLCVTACTNIPIHAVVVANKGKPAQSVETIRRMVETASDVFEQVGMSFHLASVCTTNIAAAFRIARGEETGERWNHRRLTDLLSNTGGIECYFVEEIIDPGNDSVDILGLTSRYGIVLSSRAYLTTLAHEIGHLCGARDIYSNADEGRLTMSGEFVRWDYTPDDWNGGCYGRGEAGARYYPSGTTMAEIISRLLMNGFRAAGDRHYDMTLGPVYGIGYSPEGTLEKRDVDVGFEESTGNGFMFRLPICE